MDRIWMISTMQDFAQYSIERLKEEANALKLELEVIRPEQLKVITLGDKLRCFIDETEYAAPNVLFVKTGAATIENYTLDLMLAFEKSQNSKTRVVNSHGNYQQFGDKWSSYLHLRNSSISTPDSLLARSLADLDRAAELFGMPLVLKETKGARGNSVALIKNLDEGKNLLEMLFACSDKSKKFILQRCIKSSMGEDIRVLICGGKAVAAIKRKASKGEFKANVSRGGQSESWQINPTAKKLCKDIAEKFSLNYGGIDLLVEGDKYYVCEINLAAQFVGIEKATGVNAAKLCLEGLFK